VAGLLVGERGDDIMDLATPVGMRHFQREKYYRLVQASVLHWHPVGWFDLITCVHGLRYLGDKLGLIIRAASWLKDDGLFVANLDLNNIKLADGRSASRIVARELRRVGIDYDRRSRLLRCRPLTEVEFPFRYCGADDQARPNYTKQPAVDSYYDWHPTCLNTRTS
jgi:hypothetical protein